MSDSGKRYEGFLLIPFDHAFDWLHTLVVKAGDQVGVHVARADDIFKGGVIIDQVREHILDSDVVIAVCTGRNANVFYELGIAESKHRPVLIAESREDLPFDLQHFRAQFYGGTGPTESRDTLLERVVRSIRDTLAAGPKQSGGQTKVPALLTRPVPHAQGFRTPSSRAYATCDVEGFQPSAASTEITDAVFELVEPWFQELCSSATVSRSNREVIWWQAPGSGSTGPDCLLYFFPGPVILAHKVLPMTSVPEGSIVQVSQLIDWWWEVVEGAAAVLKSLGCQSAQVTLRLQTQPGPSEEPRIVDLGFEGLPVPRRGEPLGQVPPWSVQLPYAPPSEWQRTRFEPALRNLLGHFSYRGLDPTLAALGLAGPRTD